MKPSTLDVLIWVLIYGGLLAVGLGLAVQRTDDPLGWGIVTAGGMSSAVGAVLIYVRSRMSDGA
jgi:hypothetical protein